MANEGSSGMRFGFQVPNFGPFADVRAVAELAALAERCGWDGFFVWDHVDYFGIEPNADPWIVLTAVALATERIAIGPMVTPLVRRHPAKLAREISTLDHLSAGRVIFGAGSGAPDAPESTAFGEPADPRTRADIVDEVLEVLCQWWSDDPVDFDGDHVHAHIDASGPTYQQPRVPIWLAGTWPTQRPFRRAARWDGVHPMKADYREGGTTSPDEIAAIVEFIARFRDTDGPFDVIHNRASLMRPDTAMVYEYAHAGATWWVEGAAPFETLDDARRYVESGPPRP